jgi:hypothetical protein
MHLKSLLKSKALLIITLLAMSFSAFAQAPNLLNYQGVARNNVGNPLPNQTMKLRLSIHDLLPSGAVVYSEIRQITTNLGGLFSVQIGSAGASSSTGTLGGVNWVVGNKFLQVELDPASNNNYIDIGTVQLVSVPYAFAAGTAANVKTNSNLTGVVTSVGNATSIANGAITSDMIGTLNKSKVGLNLVDNTSDAAKPISTATQAALDLKANVANVTTSLGSKLNIADSTNAYVTPAQLAAKTFDQAPINSAIAGKLAIADSTNGYVTPAKLAAKTFDTTSLSNRINTKANDAAVTTALNLKANTSDLSAGLALKIDANKLGASNGVASLNAVGIIPSSQLPPVTLTSTSVVASDAAMIALSSATVGSIAIRTDVNKNYVLTASPASTLGNWVELLTPAAPVQAVNGYTGSVNLTKSDLGLSDVNNTADFDKPISTATQNALNLKANKTDVDASLANKISTADATAALNLKANKTDVDAALANKISTADATAALNLKANITDVDAALANKISTADATAALNLKSNKTEVDAALANKISTADATAAFNLKLDANKVAAANGVASLNAQGKIPTDQIPAISFSSVKVLASEAEMLALSTAVIGSVVIRTDESKNYVLSQSNPAERANWVQLLTPAAPVQSVNGKTGTVSISQTDIGLENVQNTSDADKVISTRTQTALDTKVDKVTGKDLSTNDYTTVEKTKLASISVTPNLASGVTGILPVANGGTGVATLTGLVKGTGTSALTAAVPGTDYQAPILLTTTGSGAATLSGTTINIPTAVPYSGATGAVNLGAYDLKVNTLTIGLGGGNKEGSTALGYNTLKANTTGVSNTATGYGSLSTNQGGSDNSAVGYSALFNNIAGNKNTGVGNFSLYTNTGSNNSAVGYAALAFNTSGSNNVAIGLNASQDNSTGSSNTSVGKYALLSNTIGSFNTAIGTDADVNSNNLSNATAIGYGARVSASNTIQLGSDGNSFVTGGVTYTPAAITNVRTSGTLTLGAVTYPKTHAATSGQVLTSLGSGTLTWTTASGAAITLTTTGSGAATLTGTTLNIPTGVPYSGATGAVNLGAYDLTLRGITLGKGAGNGTTNDQSTALGVGALMNVNNNIGGANTAFGYQTLASNTSSNNNTAMGASALKVSTGSNNTAVGSSALVKNTTGSNNVAIGSIALSNNLISSNNVAIGTAAGENMTGASNTAIGAYSDMATNTFANATAIGFGARAKASNTIQLGADGTSINSGTISTTAVTNVSTTGTLTLKDVTYPNTHAALSGQVLTSLGSGTLTWTTASSGGVGSVGSISGTSNVNGATISGTTLTLTPANASFGGIVTTGVQTFTGTKTFSTDTYVNGVTVGRGNSSRSNNYAYGYAVLSAITTGNYNNAFGHQALTANTTGQENNAFGEYVLPKNIGGNYNTAMGSNALKENTSGSGNTGFGRQALQTNSTGSNNTALGHLADVSADGLSNATAIGNGASVSASNTIQLGNTSVTNVKTSGAITAPIFASTPQALTDGTTISWNPALGLNASVTLAGDRTLSFSATPTAGAYGTLVVTQDATGGRRLTLPSTANKVLGSTSTTTISLSAAANAKDIVNFYYDGTNCYWNVGQGFGTAATAALTLTTTGTGAATLSGTTLNIPSVSSTVNAGSISGTVAVANGGTGLASTPVNGQIDIGNGTGFSRATLTAGSNISITNSAGAITIAALVRMNSDEFTATAAQTTFTFTSSSSNTGSAQTPLSKPFMYINGTRIKNSAYTWTSGTTVTYVPANNSSYALVAGDRVQFDYAY